MQSNERSPPRQQTTLRSLLRALPVAAFLPGLAFLISCSTDSATPEPAATVPATEAVPQTPQPRIVIFPVGETARAPDAEITIHGARYSRMEGELIPPEGSAWALLQVTATNTSDQPWTFLGDLYHANGLVFDRVSIPGVTDAIDNPIRPGQTIEGEIAFVIPVDTIGAQMIYGPSEERWAVQLGTLLRPE